MFSSLSSKDRQQEGPTRSKSMGRALDGSRGSNSSKSKSKQGNVSPPYRDIIDKLDLSGLGGGFHHSGPFDAAIAAQRSNAPIAAFSQSALDPTYAGSPPHNQYGSHNAPLRDSAYPRQARAGGGGGGGDGVSARAKATLAAMGADGHFNDPDNSAENVLAGMPRHERRDSNSSITLGYPSTETDAKERKILEAFGMHSEAYLDYGNSSYARKPPRASVAPSPNSSMTSYSNPNSPAPRPQTEMGKMSRADRTASIWDIEATLREGRPVGASPPPPMPIIPDRYLQAPAPTSPPNNGEPGVKRSKSLLSRMRSKKGAMISSPTPKDSYSDSNNSSGSPGAPPLMYERSNSGKSLSSDAKDTNPFDNSAAVDAGSSADYRRLDDGGNNGRPYMGPRRSTSPLQQKMENNYLKPTMSSPSHAGYGDDGQGQEYSRNGNSPRRSPQPPSPLGLPEGPSDVFGSASNNNERSHFGLGLKQSISRSHKHEDLANESATAAILAESSSKESGMTHSTSSSSSASGYNGGHNNSGYEGGGNSSGYGYAHTDSSYASDKTSTPDRSRLQESTTSYNGSNHSSNTTSPADGKLSRKSSLASRLLRGRTKRNS